MMARRVGAKAARSCWDKLATLLLPRRGGIEVLEGLQSAKSTLLDTVTCRAGSTTIAPSSFKAE